MPRPVADYDTTTKTARLRLKPRPKPYFRTAGGGKSLGYIRKAVGPGTWIIREWTEGAYQTRRIALADDIGPADGRDTLTYQQALERAAAPTLPAPADGRMTVTQAMDGYLRALAARSEHAKDAKQRADRHILPELGGKRIDALTKTALEEWRSKVVESLTTAGKARKRATGELEEDEIQRRAKDTANRILNTLRAALNHAFQDEANGIRSDAAWRRVKAFRKVGGSRVDHFDAPTIRKLIAAAKKADVAFANLCEAGYLTGARYGELIALRVSDFSPADAVLSVPKGKTGSRPVTLTGETVAFFRKIANKRPRNAVLLPRANGDAWGKSEQFRPFRSAASAAGMPATASFYSLRHSHISRAIDAGMPLSLLAENCGTSLAMIQKNYAKVLAATRRDTIERTAPRLRRVK